MLKRVTLSEKFRELVTLKYHLYNSIFMTLPFSGLSKAAIKLPIFAEYCQEQLKLNRSPEAIIETFFQEILHVEHAEDRTNVIFLFLQMIEREIVLFDALEDAAFSSIHDMAGAGSLENFLTNVQELSAEDKLVDILKTYRVRIVLTAHPTQFYPDQVLGLISDLAEAVKDNKLLDIENLLLQLGETPFRNLEKVTPLSEAEKLIYRCENIFYAVFYAIHETLLFHIPSCFLKGSPPVVELGFWPGADRDGNPFVTVETTLKVASDLKESIIKHYFRELDHLRHRLTFKGTEKYFNAIDRRLRLTLDNAEGKYLNLQGLIDDLVAFKENNQSTHQGLFNEMIDRFIILAGIFGFHFGSLDVRQDSSKHSQTLQEVFFKASDLLPDECQHYLSLSAAEKFKLIQTLLERPPISITFKLDDRVCQDIIDLFGAIDTIQSNNGEKALNRYIISNTKEAHNVLEVFLLCHWCHTALLPRLDIIPLFESVETLRNSARVMEELYRLPLYKQHLEKRNNLQTIMVGFSDGTKDGGYLTCNWEIFKCKQSILKQSLNYGINVIFFDGRGGPPSRGGGSTHQFYKALGTEIPLREVQLTIQGQTISSNFGTLDSAQFSLEQMFTAGLEGHFFPEPEARFIPQDYQLLDRLSEISYQKYLALKNHPSFLPYLENITPLKYYEKMNISSRPTKRRTDTPLNLEDLRAIPFMGAWAQMKQNISGYYGLGTALKQLIDEGHEADLKALYQQRLFFRTLLDNSMRSLSKSFLPLTQYLENDSEYGELWRLIRDETVLAKEMICRISNVSSLLENYPVLSQSINLREEMLLPLLVIQQYALIKNRKAKEANQDAEIYEKIIIKSLPPSINASRNAI